MKNEPMTGIHRGTVGGSSIVRIMPETIADKSHIEVFILKTKHESHSNKRQEQTEIASKRTTLKPKKTKPATMQGISAIITSNITSRVFSRERICGADETDNIFCPLIFSF